MAQTVKRLPKMWETQVQSLGREDLLEMEKATHSSIIAWTISWMEDPVSYSPRGAKSRTRLSDFTSLCSNKDEVTLDSFPLPPSLYLLPWDGSSPWLTNPSGPNPCPPL